MISKQTVHSVSVQKCAQKKSLPSSFNLHICVLAFPRTMRPHAIGAELPTAGSEVQEGSAGTSGGVQ